MSFWSRQLGSDLPNTGTSPTNSPRQAPLPPSAAAGAKKDGVGPPPTTGPPPTARSSSSSNSTTGGGPIPIPLGRPHPLLGSGGSGGPRSKSTATPSTAAAVHPPQPPNFSVFAKKKDTDELPETHEQEKVLLHENENENEEEEDVVLVNKDNIHGRSQDYNHDKIKDHNGNGDGDGDIIGMEDENKQVTNTEPTHGATTTTSTEVQPSQPQSHETVDNNNNNNNGIQEVETDSVIAALPPGWMELIDPTSGSPYYYNEIEQITSWEKPSFVSNQDMGDRLHNDDTNSHNNDDATQKDIDNHYDNNNEDDEYVSVTNPEQQPQPQQQYAQETTDFQQQQKTEEAPTDTFGIPSEEVVDSSSFIITNESSSSLQEKEQTQRTNDPLPLGWIELVDPTSGHPYYYHEGDQITSWDRPVAAVDHTEGGERGEKENHHEEEEKVQEDDEEEFMDKQQHEQRASNTIETHNEVEDQEEEPTLANDTFDDQVDPKVESVNDKSLKEMAEPLVNTTNTDTVSTKEEENPDTNHNNNNHHDLPDSWVELIDPSSGAPYYLNNTDGTTCWERPVLNSTETDTDTDTATMLLEDLPEKEEAVNELEEEENNDDDRHLDTDPLTEDIVDEDGFVAVKLPHQEQTEETHIPMPTDETDEMTTLRTPLSIDTTAVSAITTATTTLEGPTTFSPRFDFLSSVSPQLEKLETQTTKKRFEFHKNIHQLDCQMASIKARMARETMEFDLVLRDWLDGGVLQPLEESADRFFQVLETNVAHRPTSLSAPSNNNSNEEEEDTNAHDDNRDTNQKEEDTSKPATSETRSSLKETPVPKQTNKDVPTTPTTLVSLERRLIKLDTAMTTHAHRTLHDSKAKNWDTLRSTIQHEIMPAVRLEFEKGDKREKGIVRRFEVLSGIIARKRAEEVAERKATIAMLQKRLDDVVLDDRNKADEFLHTIQNLRSKLHQERAERKRCDRKVLDKITKSTKAMKRALLEHVGSAN